MISSERQVLSLPNLQKGLKAIGNHPELLRLLRNPRKIAFIFMTKKQYIFLLSHMRSRSTLLAHILGSNPEISGYSEMHLSYSGLIDFLLLRAKVYLTNDCRLDGKYVLDKILHNHNRITLSASHTRTVKYIYLIRVPRETVPSIIQMGMRDPGRGLPPDAESAVRYYVDRVDRLREMAVAEKADQFFVKSEQLLSDAKGVLSSLSKWLELEQELSPTYRTFEKTGQVGYGDTSETIKAGMIVGKAIDRSVVKIRPELAREAEAAYARCTALLENLSVHYHI
jgi:hypothetical protein